MNRLLGAAFGALTIAITPLAAQAQGAPWPSKPIRAVVPFAAGAATDTVARTVLEQVSRQLGQPIIIDNKPGAGGTIGEAQVVNAEADGYTILVHSNTHTVTPFTYRSLPYDPQKDLVGITPLVSVPMVMVTSPQSGVRTLPEFVARAKASPGKINYASAGSGGVTHLGAERLRVAAGFDAVHIPTKGSNEALTEVMAGRVDFYLAPVGLTVPQAQAGKLVPLAVSSSRRSSALPNIPTTVEAGFPNSGYEVWIGMLANAKTPAPILQRLHDETVKAMQAPAVQERLKGLIMEQMTMPMDRFNAFRAQEFRLNAELTKAAGIQPQ
jgi:tripartite-type tricarboxylate transporter receptor subunit TctC